jgi:hypothetical protein
MSEQKELFARQRLITRKRSKAATFAEKVRLLIQFFEDRRLRAKSERPNPLGREGDDQGAGGSLSNAMLASGG